MRKPLFPSSKASFSENLKEAYFEELFSEDSILNNRLKPVTKEDRERRRKNASVVKAGRVTRTFEREVYELYRLLFLNVETYDTLEVQVTSEHPFWVLSHDKGGKGRYVPVKNLEIGMRCISVNGTPIQLLEKEHQKFDEPVKVYNFEVEGAHNYFVGETDETSVLVHNKCDICDDVGVFDMPGQGVIVCCGTGAYGLFPTTYVTTCYCQSYKAIGPGTSNIKFGGPLGTITDVRGATTIYGKETVVKKYSTWVTEIDTPDGAFVGASAGNHGFVMFENGENKYYGAAALDTCIGVVMYSAKGRFIAGFHFTAACNESATINQYSFPDDTVAVIAGGTNDGTSIHQLYRTISDLRRNGIHVIGVVDGDGVFFDSSGKMFTKEMYLIGTQTKANEEIKGISLPLNE